MRAVRWYGAHDIRVEHVPDPQIVNPGDAIIRVTATAICGSDLHLYNDLIPTMRPGDILGHEFMGEVVEVGRSVVQLRPGDRVVVPFTIACGNCYFCRKSLWALCDNSNPNSRAAEDLYGFSPGGLFGYSHMMGGYAGGQAEYVRVPYADVVPIKVPESLTDEQALFLSDILPTGYMAAESCAIQPGDIVAVWGCGPVGQFAIQSAYLLGAALVIAIDNLPERLRLAAIVGGAQTIDYSSVDVIEALKDLTGGRGPDSCIDAVGMEAHGSGIDAVYNRVKQLAHLEADHTIALRQIIQACRKGGTIAVPGVYGGIADKLPLGTIFNKGLTLKAGQTHVQHYMRPLLERIARGEIDTPAIITHRLSLEEAPSAYRIFQSKEEGCIKVVLRP